MNLPQEICDLYKEAESPNHFFYWSSLAAISAAVGRNVWINRRGVFLTYPNIYVMLVARSGMKKSIPCTLIERIVASAEVTKVIGGRNSIEAIIDNLSKQKTLESGKILTGATAFIVNDELNSLLIHNPAAQTILTTLHDSHARKDWANTLKGEGEKILKDICLTMLTATNKSHLEEFLDPASIKGGFIGRTFVIPAEKRNKTNILLSDNEEDDIPLVDHSKHIAYLKDLSTLKGPFKIKRAAVDIFEDWYNDLVKNIDDNEDDPDETGTVDRLDTQAIKLAMILSLSENLEMFIESRHAEKAIELVDWSASCVRAVIIPAGNSEDSGKLRILLDYLTDQPGLDVSAPELDRMIDTLRQAGIVETENGNEGMVLILKDRFAKKFKLKMEALGDVEASKVVRLR
jgi:hypothetical protein